VSDGDEVRFGPDDNGKRRMFGGRRLLPARLLVPVAAVVIAALAVSLTLVAIGAHGGGARTAAAAASAGAANVPTNPSAVPRYYVSLVRSQTPYLVVRDTYTGRKIVTLAPPADLTFDAVYGAASDDRTFVVTGDRLHGLAAGPTWYLLRVTPGAHPQVQLATLSIQVSQVPTGVALSPDGTKLAVALPGSPATLQVFSVNTGARLRQWSTTAPGELTAEQGTANSWAAAGAVLRWSPDGRQLAFTWNDAEIRVLNGRAPGGDLLADSKPVAPIGTTFATLANFTCKAAQGWQLLQGGQGVVCAGAEQDHLLQTSSTNEQGCRSDQRFFVGFVKEAQNGGGGEINFPVGEPECPPGQVKPGDGAYLGWASPDGSVLIGSQVWVGNERSGIFRGDTFTALPAQAASSPVPAAALDGTVAW
jgi:hypothetical protein